MDWPSAMLGYHKFNGWTALSNESRVDIALQRPGMMQYSLLTIEAGGHPVVKLDDHVNIREAPPVSRPHVCKQQLHVRLELWKLLGLANDEHLLIYHLQHASGLRHLWSFSDCSEATLS